LWRIIAKFSVGNWVAGNVFSTKLFSPLIVSYEFQKIRSASLFLRMGQVLIVSLGQAFEIVVFDAA